MAFKFLLVCKDLKGLSSSCIFFIFYFIFLDPFSTFRKAFFIKESLTYEKVERL
jgi:hypothetical protein